tara:strand:- start:1152 stop:1265 length:114 start_codon:yes stop_codon:yes gene_type:complete
MTANAWLSGIGEMATFVRIYAQKVTARQCPTAAICYT